MNYVMQCVILYSYMLSDLVIHVRCEIIHFSRCLGSLCTILLLLSCKFLEGKKKSKHSVKHG